MNAFAQTRDHYRLSQEQWARAFGVARSTVSAWEGGEALPPPVLVGAYRKLQEPLVRGDLASLEASRAHLLHIGDEAEQEAARLNRARAATNSLVTVVAVTAAAVAIGLLLAFLFENDKKNS
jgi:transcriptional regulator with XRE-family HTH domain